MAGTRMMSGIVALSAAVGLASVAAPAEAARKGVSKPKLCLKGGWQERLTGDGVGFTSPGDCTSYTARGGVLRANPYPRSKQACDGLPRGTFRVEVFRYYTAWTCSWAGSDVGAAQHDRLLLECRAAGGDYGGVVSPSGAGTVGFECLDFPDIPQGASDRRDRQS